ncbi:MAG: BrnA antitoxin family protein [Burkholderiaceae bacterium]
MSKVSSKKRLLPKLNSDKEAEDFVSQADLTDYDLSEGRTVQFEFEKKTAQINMRMPEALVAAIKKKAQARGIPYQRFIRETLEKALR